MLEKGLFLRVAGHEAAAAPAACWQAMIECGRIPGVYVWIVFVY